jgi:hypothetical protein
MSKCDEKCGSASGTGAAPVRVRDLVKILGKIATVFYVV